MNREVKRTSMLDRSIKNWKEVSEDYEINPKGINGIAYIGKCHNGSSTGELRDLGKYFMACLIDKTTRYVKIAWDETELFFVDMQDVIDREIARIDWVTGRRN